MIQPFIDPRFDSATVDGVPRVCPVLRTYPCSQRADGHGYGGVPPNPWHTIGRFGSARFNKCFCAGILLFCAMIFSSKAEEQTVTYRVVGLCTPDRQGDLREAFKEVPNVEIVSIDYDNGECAIRYDLTKLSPGSNPKKPPTDEAILKQLKERLNGVSHGLFSLKPRCALPKDKLQKIEIKIGILDCKGCRLGTYYAVAAIEGVEQVNISTTPSQVIAWIDASKTNREALVAALKKARVDFPAE